jgi:hypothetical protein
MSESKIHPGKFILWNAQEMVLPARILNEWVIITKIFPALMNSFEVKKPFSFAKGIRT